MSGFHFSSINHAMVSENPSDSINLFWNQQMEKNKANAISFFTPNFDASIGFEYPEFGAFGNNLLNPMLAIQQTMQSFQNGSWMNGMNNFGSFGNFGNFGNFGGFGNFTSPWGNWQSPWGNANNNSSQGKTAEEKLQYAQYDKMKKILNEYKKVATDSEKAYIEEALSKSGKIEEKLQALKDVTKKLDSTVIKESLLSLDPYKAQLIKSGYKVSNNDADNTLLDSMDRAEAEIRKFGKVDTLCSQVLSGNSDKEILKIMSYWNDKYNSVANHPKGIIRLIAEHLPQKSGNADPYTNQKEAINKIANSLIAKVNEVKASLDKNTNFTLLDNSSKEVTDALVTATGSNDNFNKANLNKLATKIDDLYARLRLIEAEKIRNSIQKDYKFVNDITGKTIVDDKLIVSETENDLTAEGITPPSSRDAVPSGQRDDRIVSDLDSKPVDEQIEGLVKDGEIKETNVKKGIYKSGNDDNEKPHFYMKKDEKLVELKDVVSIDKDNNCKMKDGSPKKLADVEKVEVSPSDIKQYNATLKKIKELKDGGKLVKCPTNLPTWNKAGVTLYWSKGRQANGAHQCFVVMGNELMQINCKYVDKNGKIVMEDGTTKDITQLTEDDCTIANSADVLATDEPKPTASETSEQNGNTVTLDNTGEMADLAEELKLTETGVTGYYRKGNAHYKYNEDTQKFEYLSGVTKINDDGTMVKNGHKEAIREVEKPEESGKVLRKKLRGNTSDDEYKVIAKKMNSFSTYTDADDIVKFIDAYNDERGYFHLNYTKLCAQIATEGGLTEGGLTDDEKISYLKTIAKKVLIVARKAKLSDNSDEITGLKNFINSKDIDAGLWGNLLNYEWNDMLKNARKLDAIIIDVLAAYNKSKKETTVNTEA